jgi:hypothetical protein
MPDLPPDTLTPARTWRFIALMILVALLGAFAGLSLR